MANSIQIQPFKAPPMQAHPNNFQPNIFLQNQTPFIPPCSRLTLGSLTLTTTDMSESIELCQGNLLFSQGLFQLYNDQYLQKYHLFTQTPKAKFIMELDIDRFLPNQSQRSVDMFQSDTDYERQKVTEFFQDFVQNFNQKLKIYLQHEYLKIYHAQNEIQKFDSSTFECKKLKI